jgi:hypothetical protein
VMLEAEPGHVGRADKRRELRRDSGILEVIHDELVAGERPLCVLSVQS